jgi:hypothetical protein
MSSATGHIPSAPAAHEDPGKHHGKTDVVAVRGGPGPYDECLGRDVEAHGQCRLRVCDSGDLDLMPKSEPSADVPQRGTRRLIGPRRAFMSDAVDHHVVELDVVRTGKVCVGLRRLLEKIQTRGGGGEVLVAGTDLDVVALGDDVAVQDCAHGGSPI